ncbi:DUF1987 domain-containing protein [Bacteroidota bacterium]
MENSLKSLRIEGEDDRPSISCDADTGFIVITGKSTHEDPIAIYKSLHDWLRKYAHKPTHNTVVEVHLEYFNTSSSKCLLDAFKILESIHHNKDNALVIINWYYKENDYDLKEAGEDYQDMVKVPFKLVSIEL